MKPSEMTDEQLVKAVAEEVMGWEYAEIADGYYKSYGGYISTASFQDIYIIPDAESPNGKVLLSVNSWKPLTDPRHWMMVVERMRELGWDFIMWSFLQISFAAFFRGYKQWREFKQRDYHKHEVIGRAVLEAALAAVRGTK